MMLGDSARASAAAPGRPSGSALAEFEQVYRGNVHLVMAYFARRCAEPQIVADLGDSGATPATPATPAPPPRPPAPPLPHPSRGPAAGIVVSETDGAIPRYPELFALCALTLVAFAGADAARRRRVRSPA